MAILTDKPEFNGTLAGDDLIHLVDVSDPSDNVNGSSFKLPLSGLNTYFGQSIQITQDQIIDVNNGEEFGVKFFGLDNNDPIIPLVMGVDKNIRVFNGNISGSSGKLTSNQTIRLDYGDTAVGGTSFTFIFGSGINVDGGSITIVDGNNSDRVIFSFKEEHFDYPYLKEKDVVIKCIYAGGWKAIVLQEDTNRLGDIKMVSEIDISEFTNGKGRPGTKHEGWALCDGQNGTVDLEDRFVSGPINDHPLSIDKYETLGYKGGTNEQRLMDNQIPPHRHDSGTLNITESGSHRHMDEASVDAKGGYNNVIQGGNSPNHATPFGDGDGGGDNGMYHDLFEFATHTHPSSSFAGYTGKFPDIPSDDTHETFNNRPSYIVLGFLQRVKQS